MSEHIDALYRHHGDALLRYARKVSDGDHYAEDAAQEAWLALLEDGPSGDVRGWMATVAKREYWRWKRREARKQSVGDYAMLDAPCNGDQEAHCERIRVVRAIDVLEVPVNGRSDKTAPASDVMKANLGLMLEGYDSGDIARIRGVSGAGVRDNLTRGIKALKAHWGIND